MSRASAREVPKQSRVGPGSLFKAFPMRPFWPYNMGSYLRLTPNSIITTRPRMSSRLRMVKSSLQVTHREADDYVVNGASLSPARSKGNASQKRKVMAEPSWYSPKDPEGPIYLKLETKRAKFHARVNV